MAQPKTLSQEVQVFNDRVAAFNQRVAGRQDQVRGFQRVNARFLQTRDGKRVFVGTQRDFNLYTRDIEALNRFIGQDKKDFLALQRRQKVLEKGQVDLAFVLSKAPPTVRRVQRPGGAPAPRTAFEESQQERVAFGREPEELLAGRATAPEGAPRLTPQQREERDRDIATSRKRQRAQQAAEEAIEPFQVPTGGFDLTAAVQGGVSSQMLRDAGFRQRDITAAVAAVRQERRETQAELEARAAQAIPQPLPRAGERVAPALQTEAERVAALRTAGAELRGATLRFVPIVGTALDARDIRENWDNLSAWEKARDISLASVGAAADVVVVGLAVRFGVRALRGGVQVQRLTSTEPTEVVGLIQTTTRAGQRVENVIVRPHPASALDQVEAFATQARAAGVRGRWTVETTTSPTEMQDALATIARIQAADPKRRVDLVIEVTGNLTQAQIAALATTLRGGMPGVRFIVRPVLGRGGDADEVADLGRRLAEAKKLTGQEAADFQANLAKNLARPGDRQISIAAERLTNQLLIASVPARIVPQTLSKVTKVRKVVKELELTPPEPTRGGGGGIAVRTPPASTTRIVGSTGTGSVMVGAGAGQLVIDTRDAVPQAIPEEVGGVAPQPAPGVAPTREPRPGEAPGADPRPARPGVAPGRRVTPTTVPLITPGVAPGILPLSPFTTPGAAPELRPSTEVTTATRPDVRPTTATETQPAVQPTTATQTAAQLQAATQVATQTQATQGLPVVIPIPRSGEIPILPKGWYVRELTWAQGIVDVSFDIDTTRRRHKKRQTPGKPRDTMRVTKIDKTRPTAERRFRMGVVMAEVRPFERRVFFTRPKGRLA